MDDEDMYADLREAVAAADSRVLNMVSIKEIVCADRFKKFKALDKEWQEFSLEVLRVSELNEEPFSSPPSVDQVRIFFKYLVRRRQSKQSIAVTTIQRKWQELRCLCLLRGRHEYTKGERKQMKLFIKGLAESEGASTAGRAKPLASIEVVKDLMYFLWACDEYSFKHPRMRVQLSFAMLLMMYEGLRPGEFTECSSRRGKNEGFTYRDFRLQRQPLPDKKEIWVLIVTIRNRKNHRNVEKDAVSHILFQDPRLPHLCPVAHFCALALADDAFHNVKSAQQLQRIKMGHDVKMKDDMKDVPVLRRLTPAGRISAQQVFTADSLGTYLRTLGERAGYMDSLTPYAFRRGHANKLDQMVSSVHRRQRMGHVSDDTMQYYISSVSGVDTQSIMLDRPPMQSLVDHLRSMANRYDAKAPISNGLRLTDPRRLGGHNLPMPHSDELRAEQRRKSRPFDMRRSQRKMILRHDREVHFDRKNELDDCESELESDLDSDPSDLHQADLISLENPYAIVRNGPSPYLLSLLRYEPARKNFINLLLANVPPTLPEIIEPLQTLADPTPLPVHYEGAFPNEENRCMECDRSLDGLGSKLKANRHLLACAKARRVENAEELVYRSFHANHQRACQWSCCSHSFTSSQAFAIAQHLTKHVKKSPDLVCWWLECQFSADSRPALGTHLLQQHGLYCASTLPTDIHYCYECGIWIESRVSWNSHCDTHLSSLSSMGSFCGQIARHGLIVVAAKCVFCLGHSDSSPSDRFHQYADCCDLHRHIQRHLVQVTRWPLQCPHPYCDSSVSHEDDFWLHLTESHGIEPRKQGTASTTVMSSPDLEMGLSGSEPELVPGESDASDSDASIMSRQSSDSCVMRASLTSHSK